MKNALLNLWRFINPQLPPLDVYAIPERPRRNVKIDPNRSTTAKVVDGKTHRDTIEDDGTVVTTIGHTKPKTASDVTIDKFDMACLDFSVGVKWKKDAGRAAIMKWHWMNGQSAKQIEAAHTDVKTNELERGFSERTAADYVRAFYDADDEREQHHVQRLRPPRGNDDEPIKTTTKTVEW